MELYARTAVAVVYQFLGVGIAVGHLLLNDVEGMTGGIGQVFNSTGLLH
jgi:hypothetical protein